MAGLGVSILALIVIIVAIVLASGGAVPAPISVDCEGYWSDCSYNCSRTFNVTIPQSGDGKACPTDAPICHGRQDKYTT